MQTGNFNFYLLILAGILLSMTMAGAVIIFYIRSHRKLIKQQEKIMAAELRHQKELLLAVVQSQENERKRIGKDLHDDVGNILLNLKVLFNRTEDAYTVTAPNNSGKINSFIDDAIGQVRTISHRLSPSTLEYFGCSDALEELFQKVHSSSGIKFLLQNMETDVLKDLSYDTSLHLYRVFEELLSNTLKHAGATEIRIEFAFINNTVCISYNDNGKGYDLSNHKHGIGLHNIDSRISLTGGSYEVTSVPGNGTTFVFTIPLQPIHLKNTGNE
ncbi:MAG: sensor histidine kinase [Chitinophagaceae bacterium]|nr:sensor histidine kinase [Chitinophagaceae bacterium]